MPTDTAVAAKSCCACGADVTGAPRMKDSQSRYWCMPCGEADQRRKQLTATHAPCAGCRQQFPKGKLDKHGEHFFCKGCLKKRTRATGTGTAAAASASSHAATTTVVKPASRGGGASSSASGESGNKRVVMMAAVLGLLVVIAVLFNFVFTG